MKKRALKEALRKARRALKKWRDRVSRVVDERDDARAEGAVRDIKIESLLRTCDDFEKGAKKAETRANGLADRLAKSRESVGGLRERVQTLERELGERTKERDDARRNLSPSWEERARAMERQVRELEKQLTDKGEAMARMRDAYRPTEDRLEALAEAIKGFEILTAAAETTENDRRCKLDAICRAVNAARRRLLPTIEERAINDAARARN